MTHGVSHDQARIFRSGVDALPDRDQARIFTHGKNVFCTEKLSLVDHFRCGESSQVHLQVFIRCRQVMHVKDKRSLPVIWGPRSGMENDKL